MEKNWIKWKRCTSSIPIWSVATVFFIFSKERLKNLKKLTKKYANLACMISRAVHACRHVDWPKQFKTARKTKLHICWTFGEVLTWFGRAMIHWKNVIKHNGQANKQTNKRTSKQLPNHIRICVCIDRSYPEIVKYCYTSDLMLYHWFVWN